MPELSLFLFGVRALVVAHSGVRAWCPSMTASNLQGPCVAGSSASRHFRFATQSRSQALQQNPRTTALQYSLRSKAWQLRRQFLQTASAYDDGTTGAASATSPPPSDADVSKVTGTSGHAAAPATNRWSSLQASGPIVADWRKMGSPQKQARKKPDAALAAMKVKLQEERNVGKTKWELILQRVNRVSTFASILCAIDCTVFPLMLTVLPLINVVATGAATAWLCAASHFCALWFVGPIGGLAVAGNLLQHRQALVGLWGFAGIALILLANIHLPHVVLGMHVPHAIGQFLHGHHSVINVLGCALLLSSQRYAHRLCGCKQTYIPGFGSVR